jgi:predicted Zn-dependent protease
VGVEPIANSPDEVVTLHKGPNRTPVGTIATHRAKLILEVKTRLENAAGVAADLVLVEGSQPNAFSTPASRAGPIVGLNFGMVELLGDDEDAVAAVLGHEYAHLTLRHRESRMGRESLRLFGSTALAIALGSQGMNRGAAEVANFATQALSVTFSRQEERDADSTGLRYAATAGFDPHGAVRLWESMAAGGERTVRFLSSHPASAERVENMRALAAELAAPSAPPQATGILLPRRVIHGVRFAEAGSRSRKELPHGTRSTLKPGDRSVGCYGAAPQPTTLWALAACRSPDGGYAFLVERDADQVAAVLLRPRN